MQTVLADIHLLYVAEQPAPEQDEIIESAGALLKEEGLSYSTEIREGPSAPEILACARERDAHVIVVGARGLGAVSSALMGSVGARLVRHAPCAVFCGRGPA